MIKTKLLIYWKRFKKLTLFEHCTLLLLESLNTNFKHNVGYSIQFVAINQKHYTFI